MTRILADYFLFRLDKLLKQNSLITNSFRSKAAAAALNFAFVVSLQSLYSQIYICDEVRYRQQRALVFEAGRENRVL